MWDWLRRALLPAAALAWVGAWAGPVRAETPHFALPVDCRIGESCFVQNYVDEDLGPGYRDYACGTLTYDGHNGTDFRIADLAAMRRGVAVVAAAPGTVTRVRDGVDDVSVRSLPSGALTGREAGNAVVIDHGGGWESQYSHLRRGSILVKPGDKVAAGGRLGLIGLSGNTEFPHVDFAVRRNGQVLDPFVGEVEKKRDTPLCNGVRRPLWDDKTAKLLVYRASGLLSAGFASEIPDAGRVAAGDYGQDVFPANIPQLAFWANIMGGQPGDRVVLTIAGPDGRPLHRSTGTLPKALAVVLLSGVVERPSGGWPAGAYLGRVALVRDGTSVIEAARTATRR